MCELQKHKMEWIEDMYYEIGDLVVFKGIVYKCIQTHTSHPEYGFPNTTNGILWSSDKNVVNTQGPVKMWSPAIAYVSGDNVKFDTCIYVCIKTHLSNIMSSPPHTRESLWRPKWIQECSL